MPDEGPGPEARPTIEELTSRVRALEHENAALRERAVAAPGAPEARPHHRARAIIATVLIVAGVLLAPVAVVAHWAQRELTDTDRYVETVGPLASDPVMQSAIANRLTTIVMEQVDVPALVDDAVEALAAQDLPPRVGLALEALKQPVVNGIESFVHRAATAVVESDAFTTAWVDANRLAHAQLVEVMQDKPGSTLQVGDDGQLTIQLAGMIEVLKQRLVDRGFGVAANIPEVDASFTLVQTTQLVKVRNAYNLLDVVGTWLPWLSIALIAAGVLTSVRRSRALVAAGLALAGSMLLLGLGLSFGRSLYLGELTGKVERLDAAEVVFDQVVGFIRTALRTVAVAGLVVAAAAFVGGSSESARSLRSGMARGFSSARAWAQGRGVTTGRFGVWLDAHKAFVRVVIIALAGVVVVLAETPTPALVVTLALAAAALVALVELLARPGSVPSTGPALPPPPTGPAQPQPTAEETPATMRNAE